MALDLVTASFPEESQPKKRARLGWDDPDPAFLAEATRLQFQIAAQLLMANPLYAGYQHMQTNGLSSLPLLEFSEDANATNQSQHGVCYKNPVHQYNQQQETVSPWHDDDKDGHYNFEVGENLTPRYQIVRKIGEGTFGRVLECLDRDDRELVAIKVVRSSEKYKEDAMIEIDVLSTLTKNDRTGSRGFVQFKRWFEYRNHVCMVFEKLGPSLFDFIKTNEYRPFSIDLVREFGRQLLGSVAYLHGLNLIHTDLKPENVLLVSSEYTKIVDHKSSGKYSSRSKRIPQSNRIKLIDFGSTTPDRKSSFSVVSTRHYRAPEVILGCGWSFPCDIWSIGCILVELCSGEVLFQTHENLEHLAMMERVLGPIPHHMIRRASKGRADKYFRHGRRLNWPEGSSSRNSVQDVKRVHRLKEVIFDNVGHSGRLFLDLLHQLLEYDPASRLTAKEALDHPFFRTSSD